MSKTKSNMKIRTVINNNDKVINKETENKKNIKTKKNGYINIRTTLNTTFKIRIK